MGKFDDLFNEFFDENEKPKVPKNDEGIDEIGKVLNDLIKLKKATSPEEIDNRLNALGEPDFVEFYEENGMYFKKEIWHTKLGKLVKTGMSDVPFKDENDKPAPFKTSKKTKTLEEMLEEAVLKEDYELAATLRDEIKRRDENSENQEVKK